MATHHRHPQPVQAPPSHTRDRLTAAAGRQHDRRSISPDCRTTSTAAGPTRQPSLPAPVALVPGRKSSVSCSSRSVEADR
jgi:hypothetical protein